jgi:GNAT superfamily N-acetyltransferase
MIRELGLGETALAEPVLRVLRPAVADLVARIDERQRPEGYRLVAAFAEERAVAAAGFRLAHNLAWGRHLYVDDLVTVPEARGHGHARALMGWLVEEAARLGCETLQLDSGVGSDRTDAHRLYFNEGLRITSYHFARELA